MVVSRTKNSKLSIQDQEFQTEVKVEGEVEVESNIQTEICRRCEELGRKSKYLRIV